MALKSEQAQALRRRVLGGVVRNLALFTAIYLALCLALETFAVPLIAERVADSTSAWRTLDSSSQFEHIMADKGLALDNDLFHFWSSEEEASGRSSEPGSLKENSDEIDEIDESIRTYAAKSTTLNETAIAATENDFDGESAGASATTSTETTPFVSYEDILRSYGINPDEASAAQAFAALRISASIQDLQLALDLPSGIAIDSLPFIISAAIGGFDGATLRDLANQAYADSQKQAFDNWEMLTPSEQARSLGVSDDSPVWQVEVSENGTYEIRDIAIYSMVKSFKIPLALLAFALGWLIIILRALNRSLHYFDDLSGAVARLLADKEAPIDLPADLSIARNELAVIRAQSLADERAAHAAEQRKNELVAYLAHDIRTPLTSVLGYLDLLRETTDLPRDTLRRYADIAYSKAERLETLINEFFEITRYNLSAIPIERETVGVRLFCQQVAESFFPEASGRNIRISVDVAGTEQFFVDPDKLARALGNVLRNAVAYADANSTIAIAARQDARWTTITVANRGREISDAHLETIFEKFYREDGARTSKSGGAGLGLAIAKEIVVAHHGDIEAASQGGVTVFTLRVPTRGDGPAAPAQPLASARAARPARATARHAEERPATHRQSPARLNPCNARPRSVPARKPVRDNTGEPRRRGPSH